MMLAVAGFCYATLTASAVSSRSADVPGVAPRRVGSGELRFTNPLFQGGGPTDFDLGDATFGSIIQRYITAAGGVRPYNYIYGAPSLKTLLGPNSSLLIGQSGYMAGSIAFNSANPLVFGVTATDSTGSSGHLRVSANFHITPALGGVGVFRFAVDNINNGLVGLNYVGALDTIGPIGTVTYTIVPNTLTLNGAPIGTDGKLENVGLSLCKDGVIYGKPLLPGQVSFKAHATDSQKRVAKDRTNTVLDLGCDLQY